MLVKLTKGVNFNNILQAAFCLKNVYKNLILFEKAAYKILVNLTIDRQETVVRCTHHYLYRFCLIDSLNFK